MRPDRLGELPPLQQPVPVGVEVLEDLYIYIYIYVYRERERDMYIYI